MQRSLSMKKLNRNSLLKRFSSSSRKKKDFESLDLSLNYGSESYIFRDRFSHTSDLETFDNYLKDLRSARDNVQSEEPVCEEFWLFIRNILEKASYPCEFESKPSIQVRESLSTRSLSSSSLSTNNEKEHIINHGPKESAIFYQRYADLAPVNPINPMVVSQICKVPVQIVLSELLHATLIGLVSMHWAPKCMRCGSNSSLYSDLRELPSQSICGGCQYENEVISADHVMVMFSLNPKVLYTLQKTYGCVPSRAMFQASKTFALCPANVKGIARRISVGCGGEYMFHPPLPPGSYRMRCPLSRTDNLLKIRKQSTDQDKPIILKLPLSSIEHNNPKGPLKVIDAEHGKIHFDVYTDTNTLFGLVILDIIDDDLLKRIPFEEHQPFVTASYLFHNHLYQRNFPNQTIQKNPHLSIELVYLVFTDVVGSTNLYAEVGDAEALRLIQTHFKVLFTELSNQGRVVKTIGDSVMASFLSGESAIEAVSNAIIKVRKNCISSNGQRLQIRAGIHCGSALVVPLNGIHDYFGQTVNLAARVESSAGASECLMTKAVVAHPDALKAHKKLQSKGDFINVESKNLKVKGIEEAISVTGFRLKDA